MRGTDPDTLCAPLIVENEIQNTVLALQCVISCAFIIIMSCDTLSRNPEQNQHDPDLGQHRHLTSRKTPSVNREASYFLKSVYIARDLLSLSCIQTMSHWAR